MFLITMISGVAFAEPNDTEILNSFKQYVDTEMQKVFATYEGNHNRIAYQVRFDISPQENPKEVWFKSTEKINKAFKIDLQRTTSLISPYVGTLEVDKYTEFSSDYPTEVAAKMSFDTRYIQWDLYKFTVAYQENQWVITGLTLKKQNYDAANLSSNSIFYTLKCSDDKY